MRPPQHLVLVPVPVVHLAEQGVSNTQVTIFLFPEQTYTSILNKDPVTMVNCSNLGNYEDSISIVKPGFNLDENQNNSDDFLCKMRPERWLIF